MYITWKSVTSDTNKVVINSMPYVTPEVRVTISETEGKDGATITTLGYKPYIQSMEITLLPDADLDTVKLWLTGSSILVRSDDSTKYVNAQIISQIDWEKLQSTKSAQVDFFVGDPYRYVIGETVVSKTTFPATYVNTGTEISLPSISITGSGTVVIVVNGITMTYVFDTGYTTIDCMSKEAFYSTTLKNRNLTLAVGANGERLFPHFSVGSNTISVISGTVTRIDITPRTRFI